jgi:hypothetical protein
MKERVSKGRFLAEAEKIVLIGSWGLAEKSMSSKLGRMQSIDLCPPERPWRDRQRRPWGVSQGRCAVSPAGSSLRGPGGHLPLEPGQGLNQVWTLGPCWSL